MVPTPLSFFPLAQDVQGYSGRTFAKDALAALSVALLALPQAMAYAFVAGLPPQVGIFSAIFGTLFAAAFGHSPYLITGPTTQTAILLQSGLSEVLTVSYPNLTVVERGDQAVGVLLQLVLLVGIFQVLAGMVRLGRLTQFASRSVIAGYTVGVACALAVTQLFPFFGIAPEAGYHPTMLRGWYFLHHLSMTHLPTLILGLACLVIFVISQPFSKKIPIPILIFLFAALVVHILRLAPIEGKALTDVDIGEHVSKITLLQDIGPLYTELPHFRIPWLEFDLMRQLVPLALAIALVSLLQATTIGRSYLHIKDPPYNDNQEIFGLGVSNLSCAFLGGMPSGGNFPRSALNYASGAKTRFSGVLSGIFLFLIVLFFGTLVVKIPLVTLSALMLLTAYQMLNFGEIKLCVRATRVDAFVACMTWLFCLLFPFDTALYMGVAISVVLYLKQAATPLVIEYTFTNVGKLRPLESDDERPDSRIAIFQPEGELFFGAADFLQTKLRLLAEDETIQVLILQLLNVRHIDASICLSIENVNSYLLKTKRLFMIAGVSADVYEILKKAGLVDKIGEKALFLANEQLPGEATRIAYASAKALLAD